MWGSEENENAKRNILKCLFFCSAINKSFNCCVNYIKNTLRIFCFNNFYNCFCATSLDNITIFWAETEQKLRDRDKKKKTNTNDHNSLQFPDFKLQQIIVGQQQNCHKKKPENIRVKNTRNTYSHIHTWNCCQKHLKTICNTFYTWTYTENK